MKLSESGGEQFDYSEQVHGPQEMLELIVDDGRYPPDAFEFLHEGLEFAARSLHGDGPSEPGTRHVSGAQLCEALRDLAIRKWGPLSRAVLRHWCINATLDFGNMVYLLVDNDFMQKTEQDSLDDFRDVYDFEKAFRTRGHFELKE